MKYKNLFYFYRLNAIGGIETFFWELAKKYRDKDIVVFYKVGDPAQVRRLSEFIRVKQYTGGRIECVKAFLCNGTDIIDYLDADEYIGVLHGDYKALGVNPSFSPKITKFIAISEVVKKSHKELTGHDAIVCYNPYTPAKPRKILNLISATRLTKEKGRDRIIKLAEAFDNDNIPYTWQIFSDDQMPFYNPNIIVREPRLNISDYIANSDYLVQLSDTEGYCYSVVEALSMGVPVIATDCPVYKEIGLKHGSNGFILPFDMTDIPTKQIYKGLKKFDYKPLEDDWADILADGESSYQKDLNTIVKVKCTNPYYDLQLNRQMQKGEIYETNIIRAELIEDARYGVRI